MALVLDTGALVAYERGEREVTTAVKLAQRRQEPVLTSSGCVAQAWRGGGPKQAMLARLLRGTDEHGLDPEVSRTVGALCATAHSKDVVDAHVAWLAKNGDVVVTSDPHDVQRLLEAAKVRAKVQRC
jgi:hypothetical protein